MVLRRIKYAVFRTFPFPRKHQVVCHQNIPCRNQSLAHGSIMRSSLIGTFFIPKKSSLLRNHSYLKIYKSGVWNHKNVGCTPTGTSRRNSKPSYVLYFIGSFCCRYTHTHEGYSTTMFYGFSACLASVIAYYFINR